MQTRRCRLGLSGLNKKLYAGKLQNFYVSINFSKFNLLAGGYDSLNFLCTVECYDPILDKWEYVANMNIKRSRMVK